MRRGLFALPVPVFVFLAYNAKVPQAYEGDAVDKCGTWRGTYQPGMRLIAIELSPSAPEIPTAIPSFFSCSCNDRQRL